MAHSADASPCARCTFRECSESNRRQVGVVDTVSVPETNLVIVVEGRAGSNPGFGNWQMERSGQIDVA
jgi:hypothetical protein